MGKPRVLVIGAVVLAVAATGVVIGIRQEREHGGRMSVAPAATASAVDTASPSATPDRTQPQASLAPVLKPATAAAKSDAGKLAKRIAAAGKSGGKSSSAVLSADSGKLLYKSGAQTALIPASTNKLLTTAAALDLLGPGHTFTTKVVSSTALPEPTPSSTSSADPDASATPSSSSSPSSAGSPSASAQGKRSGKITLVGGGDPYLTGARKDATVPGQASMEELAADTAERLQRAGIGSVQLGYDASLFSGPAWNPAWPDGYQDVVTPTSALWVDEGRVSGSIGPRESDPAKSAAEDFAGRLKKEGIKVSKITDAKAARKAAPVAEIRSLSLERIVEKLLMASDNDAAEVVLRQAGIAAKRGGSIEDGTAAVHKTLAGLHAWVSSTHTDDGSGLSRNNRVSAEALVKVIRLAASGDQPKLSALLTGFPVAGVEGSLRYRLGSDDAKGGRGLVRAKTGTLRQVHSLAGYAYTRDGELLVFAFLVSDAKSEWNAVVWLDKVSAAVATCGCKR